MLFPPLLVVLLRRVELVIQVILLRQVTFCWLVPFWFPFNHLFPASSDLSAAPYLRPCLYWSPLCLYFLKVLYWSQFKSYGTGSMEYSSPHYNADILKITLWACLDCMTTPCQLGPAISWKSWSQTISNHVKMYCSLIFMIVVYFIMTVCFL